MNIPSTTQAQWRKWAVLLILYVENGSMTTKQLLDRIESENWNVLPANGRMDAVHWTCRREADRATRGLRFVSFIERIQGRPTLWQLTDIGRSWVGENLIENPNITPEKSNEDGAYRRR